MKCIPSFNNPEYKLVLDDNDDFVYEGPLTFWDAVRTGLVKVYRLDTTEYLYDKRSLINSFVELETNISLNESYAKSVQFVNTEILSKQKQNLYIQYEKIFKMSFYAKNEGNNQLFYANIPTIRNSLTPFIDRSKTLIYPKYSRMELERKFQEGIEMFDLNGYTIVDIIDNFAITEQECCKVTLYNDDPRSARR